MGGEEVKAPEPVRLRRGVHPVLYRAASEADGSLPAGIAAAALVAAAASLVHGTRTRVRSSAGSA